MWPFRRKPVLDDAAARWHVDNMCWLLRHFANTSVFRDSQLVLPAPGFFDIGDTQGHAQAEAMFVQIKAYAGMSDWPVELVSDVPTYEYQRGDLIQAAARRTPLGLFMRDHDEVVRIAYAPNLLKKPVNLIATLAHELAHYLVTSVEDTLPCPAEDEKFLTDQTACFMGFGVFLANSAFEFDQWRNAATGTEGWSTQRNGYLPETDLLFDLALFITAKNLSFESALPYLKPSLTDRFKHAIKDVQVYGDELAEAIDTAIVY